MVRAIAVLCGLVGLVGCSSQPDPDGDVSGGLLGGGLLDVFPNTWLVADGKLAIPPELIPTVETPWPTDRQAWRTGFSPAQPAVLQLDDVDASTLPRWHDLTPGEGGVLLVDLTNGRFLSVMAELDAHPDAAANPSLIIRPQEAMAHGHEVAMVVTTEAAARPERFDAILQGDWPEDFEGGVQGTRDLVDTLEGLGVARDDIALAWSFPIGDGTAAMRSAVSQVTTPTAWDWVRVRNVDDDPDLVVDSGWRMAWGTFETEGFLLDESSVDLGADGSVAVTGTVDAPVFVYIPASVKDAPAGTVPIVIYGHGIFGSYDDDFDPSKSPGALATFASEGGYIMVSTRWRGLDAGDLGGALAAGNDFGKMPQITDRFIQGQASTRALIELVRDGALFDDPVFQGASGQSLADPSHVVMYGISMGGIEGGVAVGLGAPVDGAVLHVAGSMWSSMLERSNNWTTFEDLVSFGVPDPADRQLLFALSQLWWDAADPISYTEDLRDKLILVQMSLGDDAVSNMGSLALGRSAGLPLLQPSFDTPYGFETAAAPLPAGSRAFVEFDSGRTAPPDVNRPAETTGAHRATTMWPGTRGQILDFLQRGQVGTVNHYCGAAACSDSNRGDWPQ